MTTAPFEVQYGDMPSKATSAASEATNITAPTGLRVRAGRACFAARKLPRTLTPITRSQSSALMSVAVAPTGPEIPAQHRSASIVAWFSMTLANAARTSDSIEMSHCTKVT